jgi:N-methylhydantoinase A
MHADGPVLGVDVGGTFTDVVLLADGDLTTAKVPTTEADQSDGVVAGIREACADAGVRPAAVARFRHAMTVATNALLEGEGAETALVTTAGFGDVVEIGRQDRPALYDLDATRPDPLVPAERRFEVAERATTEGVEREVDEAAVREVAAALDDVESVAVSFLHAYAHPANEARAAAVLREELDARVTASHEVLPTFREYERTATTVADAAVTPLIDRYVGRLAARADAMDLPAPRVMQSNGGIADADAVREHAVTTALSGPAAGVVGAALFEPDAHEGIVSFDMGGTSCDVGLVRNGDVERTTEADVGGHPVRVPMVDVHTVGAGGGSVAWVDAGGALRVGPRSAGADPGPACYGQGGTDPTVTDAALVLGYLGPDAELGGDLALDADRAEAVLTTLAAEADLDGPAAAARGVYRVVNAAMTRAIRSVTVERGHDPRDLALVAFGGAGPMHAGAIADRLDVGRVDVPRANGVLSALGLLAADEQHDAVRTLNEPLASVSATTVAGVYDALAERVRSSVSDPAAATVSRAADLRYAGQSYEVTVPVGEPFDPAAVAARFHDAHHRERGYRLPDEPVTVVNLRATATLAGEPPALGYDGSETAPRETRPARFGDEPVETPVYDRDSLAVDATLAGPAIAEGGESTVVLPPDWTATVDERGTLVMEAEP